MINMFLNTVFLTINIIIGDKGDLFYILVTGGVDVIVPIPQKHTLTKYQLMRHW